MIRPGKIVKASEIVSVDELPSRKRIHMVDFRYKIPEPLFAELESKAKETGYHMNEICTISLEAFFRKNKKKP